MGQNFHYKLGIRECRGAGGRLLKGLIAEFCGIFLLNYFGCGACTQEPTNLHVSFSFGLIVFVILVIISDTSGGHINPAITIAMFVVGRISAVRALLYVIAQCLGAICGTAFLTMSLHRDYYNGMGHTLLAKSTQPLQGLIMEFFLGCILVLTVFAVVDENRSSSKYYAPFAIAMAVMAGHLGVIKYTGASMNPARTLGTAIITHNYDNIWVYWVGPITGGIFAALLYIFVFEARDPNSSIVEYRR